MRIDVERRTSRRSTLVAAVGVLALSAAVLYEPARAQSQAGVVGRWTTLSTTMPINPVHVALLRNGKVLVVSGSGNVATETNFRAAIWDPQSGTIAVRPVGWDMFCNGMVTLPDGRVLINGGTLQYDPFHGQPRNAVYDPATDLFMDIQNMAHGRWYPTTTLLGDGRVMTFSGLDETGATNTAVEFYTLGSGWSSASIAAWTPPLYPRMHLLPDGRVLYSGSGTGSRFFTPSNGTWSAVAATTRYSGTRTYGTSVLLPLMASSGYAARVMILGGGNPATSTTEILDLSATPLQWQSGPPMSQPRIEMNATILPSGKVLATGGSLNDEETASASLKADLYNPATNTFASAGSNALARLYHSNSLLLPDATVALVGGNPTRGSYQSRIEIYEPAYLFKADGTAATRPVISGVTQDPLAFGSTFQVQTPDAASIGSVVLVRPGVPTHAFDMDQRLVGLTYSADSGVLNVTAPPNGNIAPPGFYMLFVVNSTGVPSVATFVQLVAAANNLPPSVSIASPLTNVTVNPGQPVSFSGTGSDPDGPIASYSWTFPGGSPSSSSQQNPGNITYSTPGTYQASFTATDSGGLTSQAATRTITVTDFSLSATPASQSVTQGGSAAFTATVNPVTGFTGLVTFGVTGLPAGASASFSPASVSTSGPTTLTVSTNASQTPQGTYALRITGTSGPVSHPADVTLVVNNNLPPSVSIATPLTNVTVNPGQPVSFTGTGSDPDGPIASYSWTFPGGSPSSSSQQNPGNITYSTPGTYQASFTATDSGGLTSPAATRTITVTDFALSATPASQAVTQGGNATFTATVNPVTGFTGLVTFSVTGLPAGASASFSPASVSTSGPTTLTVSTNASQTPQGTYPLTITGTSGPVSHSANVTLVVNIHGDFTISVAPATGSVQASGSTTYTVMITRTGGFSSSVSLSAGSLPKFVTATFSPLVSDTSTATVATKKQTKSGTSNLVFTATSGNVSRSTTVTLTVQ